MVWVTGEMREKLAADLHGLLFAEGGQNKWLLLASLKLLGWQELTGTDVNSVLYERDRGFVHDDSTPPFWWDGEAQRPSDSESLPDLEDSFGLSLYAGPPPRAWQSEALAAWRAADRRGVVEAVTGTGKTVVGILAAAEAVAGGGRVAVVVPGLDLLDQWYVRLTHDLPKVSVGRMGGGFQDDLCDHDVLVVTVQSACQYQMMPPDGQGLLIADEVHHCGADAYAWALEPEFTARLGLTATYEREDRGIERHLAPYFSNDEASAGPGSEVVARCDYERGLADDILARFRVALVGVDFTSAEQDDYELWDGKAKQLRGQLINQHGCPQEPFGEFMRAVVNLGDGGHPDKVGTGRARQYLNAFSKRRALLADCERKLKAFDKLAPVVSSAERALVFTETKESAVNAARRLRASGVSADPYTSDLERSVRKDTLIGFKAGDVRVLCAPRVLDEGVDVPEADVGVIVASSHSRRQMIQRMGRIIRPKLDGSCAGFIILYVRGTSEDPERGAHGAFLEQMTDVAEEVRTFHPRASAQDLHQWYLDGRAQ